MLYYLEVIPKSFRASDSLAVLLLSVVKPPYGNVTSCGLTNMLGAFFHFIREKCESSSAFHRLNYTNMSYCYLDMRNDVLGTMKLCS